MQGGEAATGESGVYVLILGKRIAYVGHAPPSVDSASTETIDIQGGYVIPGLCDAHVHVTAVSANLHDLLVLPSSLVAARASVVLEDMLMRGFTTVRDAGGCDWGLAKVSGTEAQNLVIVCPGSATDECEWQGWRAML
jgi:imidazolonepropionase-like amidohydrolase